MRIDLSAAPHRVDDLLRFLRMTGYLAHEVDYAIIEIDDNALPASSFGVAPIALALRLRVWNEVNKADARLLEANVPYEPLEVEGSATGASRTAAAARLIDQQERDSP